jgi:transcriptional regulator with XRE-family HTH domain
LTHSDTDSRRKVAERIKAARSLAGYAARIAFCSRFEISPATLEAWERGKNPLTFKGASRIVEALGSVGIYCSVEWLMEGKGISPRPVEEIFTNSTANLMESLEDLGKNLIITKELATFSTLNENAITTIVQDDAMVPFYEEGDYVGGIKLIDGEIVKAVNKKCIIGLADERITVRQLYKENDSHHYTISALNPNTKVAPPIEYNVKIIFAAPILWHNSFVK